MAHKSTTPTTSQDNGKQDTPNEQAPCNAKWSSSDDTTLVNTLKTFVDGNSADNGSFKPAAFMVTAKVLEHSHKMSGGAVKTTKNCSCHWAALKANCLIVRQLVNLSGFKWDDSTKMVTAEGSVWEKYLEAHPEAKHWCFNPFSLYEDILGLIKGCHAMGEGALLSYSVPHKSTPPLQNPLRTKSAFSALCSSVPPHFH
ncbi:hypothetical protein PAXRUDRAFT_772812, partial [Paxillus rubicundulus Ve08.2h10]